MNDTTVLSLVMLVVCTGVAVGAVVLLVKMRPPIDDEERDP